MLEQVHHSVSSFLKFSISKSLKKKPIKYHFIQRFFVLFIEEKVVIRKIAPFLNGCFPSFGIVTDNGYEFKTFTVIIIANLWSFLIFVSSYPLCFYTDLKIFRSILGSTKRFTYISFKEFKADS